MPEAEAIRLAQQGDAAAFERLYRLHNRRVYSLCLRMVSNTAEAEDLTQEAFLQLFRKIATFRGESAFSTWLHRLAVNVVLMKLRKKSGNESSLEELTEHTSLRQELREALLQRQPIAVRGAWERVASRWGQPPAPFFAAREAAHRDVRALLRQRISAAKIAVAVARTKT